MQKNEIVISKREQAEALRDIGLLAQFLNPASPTDIAKKLNLPANLVHHHVKKYLKLELLFELKREARKVFYQTTAKRFKHRRNLLPLGASNDYLAKQLDDISNCFMKAYASSDALIQIDDDDWHTISFIDAADYNEPTYKSYSSEALERHPAHLQFHSLRLSQKSYLKLLNDIRNLLETASSESSNEQDQCSLLFLAFDGLVQKGMSDSQTIDSFAPSTLMTK